MPKKTEYRVEVYDTEYKENYKHDCYSLREARRIALQYKKDKHPLTGKPTYSNVRIKERTIEVGPWTLKERV